jgi:hypothetical protein
MPSFNINFADEIEGLVKDGKMAYMDAIIHWCELKNVELEAVSSMIANNAIIKSKLQLEAEDLHFLPRSTKVPI